MITTQKAQEIATTPEFYSWIQDFVSDSRFEVLELLLYDMSPDCCPYKSELKETSEQRRLGKIEGFATCLARLKQIGFKERQGELNLGERYSSLRK